MKKLKKLIICLWIVTIAHILPCITMSDFSFSDEFPYDWAEITPWIVDTEFKDILKSWINEDENWFKRLLRLFMPNSDMYDWDEQPSFIFYLKTIVNLLLSFVSFIALILVIYAFYMMFFKKDEAGWTTAKQILKWVIIALFVIWLSRIIVSFLYRFEKEQTNDIWYHHNTQIINSLT